MQSDQYPAGHICSLGLQLTGVVLAADRDRWLEDETCLIP